MFENVKKTYDDKGLPPQENVVFQVKEYHIAQDAGSSKDDYIVGYLMRDALGLVAQFDAALNPTTEVKIKLKQASDKKPDEYKKRPAIVEFRDGKGLGSACAAGAIISADKCYYDAKAGAIVSNWLNRRFPKFDTSVNWAMVGEYATVFSERYPEGKPEAKYQTRLVVLAKNATKFTDIAGFKKAAVELLQQMIENDYPGPGVRVRGVEISTLDNAHADFRLQWDKDAKGFSKTPEMVVDEWLESEIGKSWVGNITSADPSDTVFEVIPISSVRTGDASLPTTRKGYAEQNGKTITQGGMRNYDDSIAFAFPVGNGRTAAGYAKADMFIQKHTPESGWISIGTFPVQSFNPPLFTASTIPTRNLPEAVEAAFVAQAKDRSEPKKDAEMEPAADAEPPAPGTGL